MDAKKAAQIDRAAQQTVDTLWLRKEQDRLNSERRGRERIGQGDVTITLTEGDWRAWRVILDVPWKAHGLHVGSFEDFAEALRYLGARGDGEDGC